VRGSQSRGQSPRAPKKPPAPRLITSLTERHLKGLLQSSSRAPAPPARSVSLAGPAPRAGTHSATPKSITIACATLRHSRSSQPDLPPAKPRNQSSDANPHHKSPPAQKKRRVARDPHTWQRSHDKGSQEERSEVESQSAGARKSDALHTNAAWPAFRPAPTWQAYTHKVASGAAPMISSTFIFRQRGDTVDQFLTRPTVPDVQVHARHGRTPSHPPSQPTDGLPRREYQLRYCMGSDDGRWSALVTG
jgi:hypothetical protein